MTGEKEREAKAGGSRKRAETKGKTRRMESSVQVAIGHRLRAYYDQVAREPVPDKFLDLLKRLDSTPAEPPGHRTGGRGEGEK